jgi:uridine monophosphate synthetase
MDFFRDLEEIAKIKNTTLCVGLDPYFSLEERKRNGDEACIDAALKANCRVIESTHPYAACYKPNLAFYEAFGIPGHVLLKQTIACVPEGIPILIDAKRGDIDSTAKAYADSIFGELGASATTLNPYMGRDSIEPFLAWEGRGLFLLCRTSNPAADTFQGLHIDDDALYVHIAKECSSWSDRIGLVVAGNDPKALAKVRAVAPQAWFLSPGIGAQGGNAKEAVKAGARADGLGILVVAARSVAQASDPAQAARELRDSINLMSEAKKKLGTGSEIESKKNLNDSDIALKTEFVRHLVETGCFRLGDFTLKSGKKSPFYIDLRRLITNPAALELAGRAYALMAKKIEFDRIAGIPAAALPLATAASLVLKKPMIWPRMPVKDHGTGNTVEGGFNAGDKALLLDDLITTGSSKIEAVDILRKEGILVEDLIVLIERGKQGRTDMARLGVLLVAFMHVTEIFSMLLDMGMIDSAKKAELELYVESE